MRRRTVLGAIVPTLFLAVAGCASGDTTSNGTDGPTTIPTTTDPTPSQRSTTAGEATDHLDALSTYLSGMEIEVRELGMDVAEKIVQLRYVTRKSEYEELGAEIGGIAGGFLREVDRGWSMERMNATILESDGTPQATWYVKAAWLAEYQRDEISGQDLSLKILNTLERPE